MSDVEYGFTQYIVAITLGYILAWHSKSSGCVGNDDRFFLPFSTTFTSKESRLESQHSEHVLKYTVATALFFMGEKRLN